MDEAKGYKRRDRTYWADQLTRWRESGLTQTEYCRRNNLNSGSLSNWKRKLKEETLSDASFVEVACGGDPAGFGSHVMELLIGTIRIRIREDIDPLIVRDIIMVLREI